jgi:hypothetical protein
MIGRQLLGEHEREARVWTRVEAWRSLRRCLPAHHACLSAPIDISQEGWRMLMFLMTSAVYGNVT